MNTNNEQIQSGPYKNEMWNKVIKIDPAHILWAENTNSSVHFSQHFLDAAKIQLREEETCGYGAAGDFND